VSSAHEARTKRSQDRIAFGSLALGLTLGAVGPSILRSAESAGILFAAWRMLSGAALYLVIMALRGRRLTLQMLRDGALGGAFFGLSIGLFYAAVAHTSVTNAMLISALRPAIVIAVVGPLMHERVRAQTVFWTAVAIAGAAFAVVASSNGGGEASFTGDAIALAGVFAGTGYLIATKQGRKHYDSFTFTTAMMFSGAAILFPLALVTGDGIGLPPAADWKWILAMAVIPGFGHVLNNYSVAHLPLAVVSNAALLNPGVVAAIAWVLIDERILFTDIVGMAITVAALGMVVWSAPSPPIPPPAHGADTPDDATEASEAV
jgi:drug/metabolite transporter (DMT)-like permease